MLIISRQSITSLSIAQLRVFARVVVANLMHKSCDWAPRGDHGHRPTDLTRNAEAERDLLDALQLRSRNFYIPSLASVFDILV